MIDIALLRQDPDRVRAAIRDKGLSVDLDRLIALDRRHVALIGETEALRGERNRLTAAMKGGRPVPTLIAQSRELRERLKALEADLTATGRELTVLHKQVPNLPSADTPIGRSEDDNVVVRTWGRRRDFGFPVRPHSEIAEHHGWIDKTRAAKVAGSRFAYLKGDLVRLQFALINFVFDQLTDRAFITRVVEDHHLAVATTPFVPVLPPYLIRTAAYDAMDRLEPAEDRYRIDGEDAWLQGSAEHVLGAMHMDEIFAEADLPLRYLGYATSFRREAGAAGKDMEGIIRLHQFDKMEMESFTTGETGMDEHRLLAAIQERLMQLLDLPYRVLQKCTFDIGKPNAKGSDIEVWLPGQGKYRETHTADYMTDYQARRLNTRVRRADGGLEFVHTNDATAFACGRALVALLETYQAADLSVTVPVALRPYLGGRDRIG